MSNLKHDVFVVYKLSQSLVFFCSFLSTLGLKFIRETTLQRTRAHARAGVIYYHLLPDKCDRQYHITFYIGPDVCTFCVYHEIACAFVVGGG